MPKEPTNVTYLNPATTGSEPEVVWLRDKNIKLERRHYKNKNWQARIRIPGAKYKYDRVSTGTPHLEEAKRFASDRFDAQNWRHQNGYSIFAPTFGKIAKTYLKSMEHRISIGELKQNKFDNQKRRLDKFIVPYFGTKTITEISAEDVQQFHRWRMEQWQIQRDAPAIPTRMKNGKIKYVTRKHLQKPSSNSQIADELVIARVLDHAVFAKEIKKEERPDFSYTKFQWKRRGTFTNEEWVAIYTELRSTASRSHNHQSLYYAAEMFRHFCLIMANAGTRPNELVHLKWNDITYYDDDDGERQVELRIRDIGDPRKHRPRSFTARPACHDYFERLRKIHKDPSDENYIFVRWNGERIKGYSERFNKLMKLLDLYHDNEGQRRTVYSLRHYYATTRLENGADPYLLSKFMGTSLAMIEKTYAHILSRRVAKEVNKRRSRKQNPSDQ